MPIFKRTGITHIQIDVDKICTYLKTLATHTVSPLLLPLSTFSEVLENIKRNGTIPSFNSTH